MSHPSSLCLVDGSGYIFRAFYALPMMTRSDGTPINAVYGFINMLMNLVKDNGCEHIVVVFDAKRKNFRNNIYPAYKENRAVTPPELVPQFPLIRQATEAFHIPWLEMEGYEADDLIATYARLATEKGWKTQIISGDKDLMQLMNEHVSLYDPLKRKMITPEDVIAKFGVSADKVVEVQSLMGDSVDNIPGATGIGPKTAAELIQQFGSVDYLLEHISDIPQPKRREILTRDKEQILISKQLVSLDKFVPVQEDLSQFKRACPDFNDIVNFLTTHEFKSLISKAKNWAEEQGHINKIPTEPQSEIPAQNYELIQDEQSFKKWIDKIYQYKIVAIDTETTALNPFEAKLVGLSLCCHSGTACYIPLRHTEKNISDANDLFSYAQMPKQLDISVVMRSLYPILNDPQIIKIGHNIKYDMHILKQEFGNSVTLHPLHDTMLMSYALYGTTHGHSLDELAQRYLNYQTLKYTEVCGTGQNQITFNQVDLETATRYAAEDADITFRLFNLFQDKLKNSPEEKIYTELDLPLIPVLCEMEQNGILVDKQQLRILNTYFENCLNQLTTDIYALAGEEFNINSPSQLGIILFEKQLAPFGKKNANGSWKTDAKILEKLAVEAQNPLAEKIIEYRMFSKLKNTYVDAFLTLLGTTHHRIHTSFTLTGTNTGRLASSEPNLQNIPIRTQSGKEIRKSFIAAPGYKLMCADYSQIELRLMADVARVSLLQEALKNNIDIHTSTAAQVFNLAPSDVDPDTRRRAKAINFGIIYGISAFGLANQLGISRTQAKEYIDFYFDKYPQIKSYMEHTIQFAREHGYVMTPFGRKCHIYGINDKQTRGFAERSAINAPIQGGAADIIKMAMIQLHKRLQASDLDIRLLLQVHDELVFEVAEKDIEPARALIQDVMENVVQLSVPLIVEIGIGNNWKDAH